MSVRLEEGVNGHKPIDFHYCIAQTRAKHPASQPKEGIKHRRGFPPNYFGSMRTHASQLWIQAPRLTTRPGGQRPCRPQTACVARACLLVLPLPHRQHCPLPPCLRRPGPQTRPAAPAPQAPSAPSSAPFAACAAPGKRRFGGWTVQESGTPQQDLGTVQRLNQMLLFTISFAQRAKHSPI